MEISRFEYYWLYTWMKKMEERKERKSAITLYQNPHYLQRQLFLTIFA